MMRKGRFPKDASHQVLPHRILHVANETEEGEEQQPLWRYAMESHGFRYVSHGKDTMEVKGSPHTDIDKPKRHPRVG